MRVAALVLAAFLLAGCAIGGKTRTVTVTVEHRAPTPQGALGQTENARYFGTPVSITRADAKRYVLVLKPQFFLVGVTANVAFANGQQVACPPLSCPGVPDDRWVIPAGGENLTFVLPATTRGTVLTAHKGQMRQTSVSAADLYSILSDAKLASRLIEPLDSGLWLTVDVDRVTSFAQQFQP